MELETTGSPLSPGSHRPGQGAPLRPCCSTHHAMNFRDKDTLLGCCKKNLARPRRSQQQLSAVLPVNADRCVPPLWRSPSPGFSIRGCKLSGCQTSGGRNRLVVGEFVSPGSSTLARDDVTGPGERS